MESSPLVTPVSRTRSGRPRLEAAPDGERRSHDGGIEGPEVQCVGCSGNMKASSSSLSVLYNSSTSSIGDSVWIYLRKVFIEEEREDEVVGEDVVMVHVGVYGKRGLGDVGWEKALMRLERVENENVGSWNEVGEEKQSRIEKAVRLACIDVFGLYQISIPARSFRRKDICYQAKGLMQC